MAEYYQGKDIGVRFDVFKDGDPERPTSAGVSVYVNKGYVKTDKARVVGTEVRYVLPGKEVERTGDYVFVFDVGVRGMGFSTHIVNIRVKKLPVKVKKERDGRTARDKF